MSPDSEQALEQRMSRTFRGLPDRTAPRSLERRVLAEIDRRSRLPWWRRSYERWPAAARVVFLFVSAGAAALLVLGAGIATQSLSAAALNGTSIQNPAWLGLIQSLFGDCADAIRVVAGAVTPFWLYGAVVLVFACYAALGGIGAAAYRALGLRHFSR